MSSALVVAHPGHEMRLYGWLLEERPVVHVLTDGSGRGISRLAGTEAVLAGTGAWRGSVFGRFTDREAYALLLSGRLDPFVALVPELREAFAAAGARRVVADPADGYNPMHDVCRLVAEAAARLEGIPCDAFVLVGPPGALAGGERLLSEEAWRRKLLAAREYAGLEEEVAAALARDGADAFRRERIGPPSPLPDGPRFYERHGERRVAEGVYRTVIRHAEHVRPLAERLAALAA